MQVIDAPQVPGAPQPKMKKMVFSLATFLVLGLMLSIGAVVAGTAFDHSLLSANDVKNRLGVRVLAVVPDAGARRWRRNRPAKEPKPDVAPTPAPARRPAPVKTVPAGRRKPPVKPAKPPGDPPAP